MFKRQKSRGGREREGEREGEREREREREREMNMGASKIGTGERRTSHFNTITMVWKCNLMQRRATYIYH
jgi:hypothetical protein